MNWNTPKIDELNLKNLQMQIVARASNNHYGTPVSPNDLSAKMMQELENDFYDALGEEGKSIWENGLKEFYRTKEGKIYIMVFYGPQVVYACFWTAAFGIQRV